MLQVLVPLGGRAESAGHDEHVRRRVPDHLQHDLAGGFAGNPSAVFQHQQALAEHEAETAAVQRDRGPGEPGSGEKGVSTVARRSIF